VANQARIYDYLLGGKDNYEADRAAVDAQVPVTRWADVPRSRVCGTVYELEAPMTTVPCALRPGGRTCGAFAVGLCSECGAAVCRHHGSRRDPRADQRRGLRGDEA
jgi:hypothetical protein